MPLAKYRIPAVDGSNASVLKELPPVWMNLTADGVKPVVTQAQTELREGLSDKVPCYFIIETL